MKKYIVGVISLVCLMLMVPVFCSKEGMDLVYAQETGNLKYAYVESPYIESGAVQNIVLSFAEPLQEATEIKLILRKNGEEQKEWLCTKNVENLYLFSTEVSEQDTGSYEADCLSYVQNGESKTLSLKDLEAKIEFGVNQEYDGYGDESVPLESYSEDMDMNVVSIGEDGTYQSEESIEQALSEAAASAPMTASNSRSSEIVVAIDPGHDARHVGANKNGLKEEELTLKIANYLKAELETYENVRVYMTRTTAACPYPSTSSSGKCIEQRAIAAANAGARIYVSLHLNSSTSSAPSGAEVIYPNNSWKPEVGNNGKELAQKIQDELVKLGLADRGIYYKNTSVNEKYPDGSISDYFAVQIYNKERGIPGIIVEHAFLSNGNDVNRFLRTEEGLKSLALADARGIADFLGVKKEDTSSLVVQEGIYAIKSYGNQMYGLDIWCGVSYNGGNVQIYSGNYSNAQLYEFDYQNGYYVIRNVGSGKVLDAKNGGMIAGTNIWQYQENGTLAQKWKITKNGDGTYTFTNALNGLVLDIAAAWYNNGTNVQLYTGNGTSAQKFVLEKKTDISSGNYSICSSMNQGYVLDIAAASRNSGANLQLYANNGTSAQKFAIRKQQNGYYTIANINSNLLLDAQNGGMYSGTNVWQYANNNTRAQQWMIFQNANGTYTFVNVLNGLVLDIANASICNGANLQLYVTNGTAAQKFVLKNS